MSTLPWSRVLGTWSCLHFLLALPGRLTSTSSMARLTKRHWMEAEKSGFSRTWKPFQELDSFSPLSCSQDPSNSRSGSELENIAAAELHTVREARGPGDLDRCMPWRAG